MKLLLHACCGPCSLEPVRLLKEAGHELAIAFANPNIQPREEYERRLAVLLAWAQGEGVPVVELPYDEGAWDAQVAALERAGAPKHERCRACYRLRLQQAAAYAKQQGYEALSTTLAVSPYQLSDACHGELDAASREAGLTSVWEDFRPYYPKATARSRALGMYRQNYCGCAFSQAEAEAEREERRLQKAQQAKQREADLEGQRAQRAARQAKFEAKQRRKREARDAARAALKEEGWKG